MEEMVSFFLLVHVLAGNFFVTAGGEKKNWGWGLVAVIFPFLHAFFFFWLHGKWKLLYPPRKFFMVLY